MLSSIRHYCHAAAAMRHMICRIVAAAIADIIHAAAAICCRALFFMLRRFRWLRHALALMLPLLFDAAFA